MKSKAIVNDELTQAIHLLNNVKRATAREVFAWEIGVGNVSSKTFAERGIAELEKWAELMVREIAHMDPGDRRRPSAERTLYELGRSVHALTEAVRFADDHVQKEN